MHIGLGQGQKQGLGSIVSYCASPIPFMSPLLAPCSVITPSDVKDPIDIHVDLINIASVSISHEILVSVSMP